MYFAHGIIHACKKFKFLFCLLHSLCENCFRAGTSLCFVQKNVENNQNYCKIDVLKPIIDVRDKGNKSYY